MSWGMTIFSELFALVGVLVIFLLIRRAGISGNRLESPSQRLRSPAERSPAPEHPLISGLPALQNRADLMEFFHLTEKELLWLLDARAPDPQLRHSRHYIHREIPKKRGGMRVLLVPKAKLKAVQQVINERILGHVRPHAAAHGFCAGRSIVTNARVHQKKEVVLTIDLRDFFPTIGYPRVAGMFGWMGYPERVARDLALLCTTIVPNTTRRRLPQGAPTSPAISNLVAINLDKRLSAYAASLGFQYTRYADDLCFSGPRRGVYRLLRFAKRIIRNERFRVNPEKIRIQRPSQRQSVTGIVVNQDLAVPREERRRLRAILHQARKTGLEKQNRRQHPHFKEYLFGKWGFVNMVNPRQAEKLRPSLQEALR
jgi:retron-type reverse transcriptase